MIRGVFPMQAIKPLRFAKRFGIMPCLLVGCLKTIANNVVFIASNHQPRSRREAGENNEIYYEQVA